MIGIPQNRLTSCGAPHGSVSTVNGVGGPSGEILRCGRKIGPRIQYRWQEKPSDVEETFGTLCHPLNLFAVPGVFDLQETNSVNRCFVFAHPQHLRLQKG